MKLSITYKILSILLGLSFVLSAFLKLYPIELFEASIVEAGISNWTVAAISARLLIAFEFIVGVLAILNITLNRKTYWAIILILIVFTIYLLGILISKGNTGNCMCFGSEIKMTPLQSIYKNIGLLALAFLLVFKNNGIEWSKTKIILIIISSLSFAIPFGLTPMHIVDSGAILSHNAEYKALHIDKIPNIDTTALNLSKGKSIFAFMSLTCKHCRIAAYKLEVIKQKNPNILVYIFLYGKQLYLQDFLQETNLKSIPYSMLEGVEFISRSGSKLPAIYLTENDTIKAKIDYPELTLDLITDWLHEHN